MKRRQALIVGAPIVAVATFMLGLRVGAGEAVVAAKVFVAPPGRAVNGHVPLALQLLTYREKQRVPETVALANLTVIARAGSKEARWTGSSNEDGIAEVALAFDGEQLPSPVHIEVLREGEPEPLAVGTFTAERRRDWAAGLDPKGTAPSVRPAKRDGDIGLEVHLEDGRLAVGFPSPVWVRAEPAARLELAPEPGLDIVRQRTCGGASEGWSLLEVRALAHVVGLGIEARDMNDASRHGTWFGGLPVAAGAFAVELPRSIPEGRASTVEIIAPNPRSVAYAEIDDHEGRVIAEILRPAVKSGERDQVPRATLRIPPLARGLHWLVVSGEPRGAESLLGAAIAKPFLVGDDEPADECRLGPRLAQSAKAEGFPRVLALDGMATRGEKNRARHRTGLFIGLLALFAAAALEVLLLTAASREARAVLLLAELDADGQRPKAAITARPPGGNLAVALLLAVLGFALLAVLLFMKA